MPNVIRSPELNDSDYVCLSKNSFSLDSLNNSGKTLIVLYIYQLPKFQQHGFKVGMTKCRTDETFWHAIKSRISNQEHELALTPEQYSRYGEEREVVYWGVCLDASNDDFKDYHVHKKIKEKYIGLTEQTQEWFNGLPLEDIVEIFNKCRLEGAERTIYKPRDEQRRCVDALSSYFKESPTGKRFLLNCKMRFGKCFTTYKFCEENDINKILILTFVPAVQDSWEEDLYHIEKEYDYFTDSDLKKPTFDLKAKESPFVVFLSLQNYLGKDSNSSLTKEKIKKLQGIDFDLVVFDEYHFGAWNDRTQETVLEDFDPEYAKAIKKGEGNQDILSKFQINTKKTICLSGTPFKALARGEFSKDNTFTYSYFDEQKNKYPKHNDPDYRSVVNPEYAQFPDMKIFGYNMSKLFQGLENEVVSDDRMLGKKYFSLNRFFETKKQNNSTLANAFVYEDEIKQWLEIIKGRSVFGADFPYSNPLMQENNKHTLWLMPTVFSCGAITDLLRKDDYFSRYLIVNLSSPEVGAGQKALDYLNLRMTEAKNTNKLGTIAITVNKLTIGVTVKPWASVFVLKDLASPESYFQSIFRIQTPYVENDRILKQAGFVYDFNIDRAAALMLKFAEQSQDRSTTKMEICKLIVKFMPIYMNGDMSSPIDYTVFFDLATLGDNNGVSLSSRIRNLSVTTRVADDDIIANMLNDPQVSDIIKHVFAHTKFTKEKTKTPPQKSETGFNSEAGIKGQNEGHSKGIADSENYVDFDDEAIQEAFENRLDDLLRECTPKEYSSENKIYYQNGFRKGYEGGVNAPIKKLQSGKDDGAKFADELKVKLPSGFYYEAGNKATIDNATKLFLNDDKNIPEEYKKSLYKRWYKDSFLKVVRNKFRRPVDPAGNGDTIENANNVIQHLISRLFQFLYISVYRETTFNEIFKNANPEVFLEAVGITKNDFETLNRYHVFQEDVLDNYIHEFFVNEDLGGKLDMSNDFIKKNYRNSFGWFGNTALTNSDIPTSSFEEPKEASQAQQEEITKPSVDRIVANEASPAEESETSKVIIIPDFQQNMSEMEKKVYSAVYVICKLSPTLLCRPFYKTIKNYLTGNSSSVYYSSFVDQPCCGSIGFIDAFKIERVLKGLVNRGILVLKQEKKEAYYPK